MPATFRDFADVAEAFGERAKPHEVVVTQGTYVAHATAQDDVVHLAELTIGSTSDGLGELVLFIPCRRLVIDGRADALEHLRRPEVPIDCMTCLVRGSRP